MSQLPGTCHPPIVPFMGMLNYVKLPEGTNHVERHQLRTPGPQSPLFRNHEPLIRGPTQNIPQLWSEITANNKSVSISKSSDL